MITVYNDKAEGSGASIQLPAIFKAPIRPDIVRFVQQQMSLNRRQPYAVSRKAGEVSKKWLSTMTTEIESILLLPSICATTICSSIFFQLQVIRLVLNPGVLVVLLPVSLVFEEVVLIAQVRLLTETCAVAEGCLHQPRPGAGGTARSMSTKNDMLCAQLLLHQASHLWLCPKV